MLSVRYYNRYVEHRDPLARAGNVIAIFILGNQPFYPLYLYFVVGNRFWPALLTFLSSPLYAAVPWLMRRSVFAGKWLLIIAGLGNTLLANKALGPESGLELFLFPCTVLGALLFSGVERNSRWIAATAPIALFILLRGRYGTPLEVYAGSEYSSLLMLHAVSAAAICVFICFVSSAAALDETSAARVRSSRKQRNLSLRRSR
jgi:hypothetical protein